jgi:hypothetical protein
MGKRGEDRQADSESPSVIRYFVVALFIVGIAVASGYLLSNGFAADSTVSYLTGTGLVPICATGIVYLVGATYDAGKREGRRQRQRRTDSDPSS